MGGDVMMMEKGKGGGGMGGWRGCCLCGSVATYLPSYLFSLSLFCLSFTIPCFFFLASLMCLGG